MDRELGAAIVQATGARVDLEHPELTVFVEVLKDRVRTPSKPSRPRRVPVGCLGTRHGPDLGRHRFARGGLQDDEARLPASPS
jgi:hypothetical protein